MWPQTLWESYNKCEYWQKRWTFAAALFHSRLRPPPAGKEQAAREFSTLFAEMSSEVHFLTLTKTPTEENRSLPGSAPLLPLCFDHQISTSHQFSPSNSNLCFTNNKEQEKGNQEVESKTRPVKAKLSKVCRFEKVLGTRTLQETEGPTPNRSVSWGRKAVFVCLFFRNPKSGDLARRARVQWENKDTYAPGRGLPLRGRPKLLPRPFPSAPRDLDPKAGRGGRFKHPPPYPPAPRDSRLGPSLNRHRPLSLPPRPHGRW